MKKDIIGLNYYLLKHLVTPEVAFRGFEKYTPRFNRSRTYKLIECRAGKAKVAVGVANPKLLPKHQESCENWKANFESYIQLMTGKLGKVEKNACCYHGDPSCIYTVSWDPGNAGKKLWSEFTNVFGFIFTSGVIVSLMAGYKLPTAAAALSVFLQIIWLKFDFSQKKEIRALNAEFESFQQESNERYSDLQNAKHELDHRYREAVLLENTSKEIQKTTDLSKILKVSLEAACKVLGFDRAFVMLTNQDHTALQTAAVTGIQEESKSLWKFSVDISKRRDNPTLLSSVYHSGNSVMIDKIGSHIFQLNEASQALIKKLNTKGFIMVAVPSIEKNWGVIIADKTSRAKSLSKKDMVLLQRVAQYLGLALDKQAKLDQEINLRKIFQRYVPATILDESLVTSNAKLGGQVREVVCMFLDIRKFTSLSQNLPPQIALDLLNQVFTMIQEVVTPNKGLIDKFLGDGALILWGGFGNTKIDPTLAVNSAFEILNRMEELNRHFNSVGLPEVRVGMGIHKGQAVVGNVGSKERMEFTAIGSTINIASRLEGLCKEFNANIVVSDSVFSCIDLDSSWEQKENVLIRGIDSPITVAAYKSNAQNKEKEEIIDVEYAKAA